MNKITFKALLRAMPPLAHSHGEAVERFNINLSEPVAWFMEQSGFKQWVWYQMHNTGAIVFDPVTRKWSGLKEASK